MSKKEHSMDKEEAVLLCIRVSLTSALSLTDVLSVLCTTLSSYKWLIGFSKLEDSFLHSVCGRNRCAGSETDLQYRTTLSLNKHRRHLSHSLFVLPCWRHQDLVTIS